MKYLSRHTQGFTVMEILVVIGIIGTLTTIVFASFSAARENARDKARIVDIAKLELILRLYVEKNGFKIDCSNGFKIDGKSGDRNMVSIDQDGNTGDCTDGAKILGFIKDQLGSVPHDPLGPDDGSYYYYFDSSHNCYEDGAAAPLLFAVNMESQESNAADVCEEVSGNDGGYLSVGDESSAPYVRKINFSVQTR